MITTRSAKIALFIVLFLLVNGNVEGEEVSGDSFDSSNGTEIEGYPSQNEKLVLEFPYDRNNTNTFARTTFVAQEEMTNFTVCFGFMVNALKSAKRMKCNFSS